MKQYTEYLKKIEDVLSKSLPENYEPNWKKSLFASLPDCISNKHLEPLVLPCRNLLSLGGKRWRPLFLVLASGLATNDGTPEENSFLLTPVVEFVHTASLIHDDIEDNADMRRGKPAAHITHGIDTAINSASWLYFVAFDAINKFCYATQKNHLHPIMHNLLTTELRRLHLGQAMDIEWHKNNKTVPNSNEYMAMVKMKTGTLASLAGQMGLLAGGGTKEEATTLGKIASDLGVTFQIQDDIINLTTGNKGKKRGDDIVEGKKSMPVLLHLQKTPNDFDKVMNYFEIAQKEGIDSQAVEKCIALIEKSGALEDAAQMANKLKANAIAQIKNNWQNEKSTKAICTLFEKL
ncbi:MAG: polyprenyl synthetase family protein [Treponema sp.]|nr:polyprenyl synthetase family protein [Treponema sp.]